MIRRVVGLALIAVAGSCSEPMEYNGGSVPDITVQDGRLVFKDEETFAKTVDELGGVDRSAIISRLQKFEYTSLDSRMNAFYKAEAVPEEFSQFKDYDFGHL